MVPVMQRGGGESNVCFCRHISHRQIMDQGLWQDKMAQSQGIFTCSLFTESKCLKRVKISSWPASLLGVASTSQHKFTLC